MIAKRWVTMLKVLAPVMTTRFDAESKWCAFFKYFQETISVTGKSEVPSVAQVNREENFLVKG